MEEEIVKFLVEKYNPAVIVLIGSRAKGINMETSDWDLYLFDNEKKKISTTFINYKDQLLDIGFRELPSDESYVFNGGHGPNWPIKVLLDNSNGLFDKVIENTRANYEKGPLIVRPEGHAMLVQQLNRWQQKMLAYPDKEIQFYHLCSIFNILPKLWFEKRNMWAISPKPALDYIKEHDLDFWNDLSGLVTAGKQERVELVDRLIKKINSIK